MVALPLLHSSVCLSVCSAIRTKNLSIWKSVIFACVVQPAACIVCTTRTVIYVVLCTLNLDPANDLVDLEKKEAAAESPISFFSWLFFLLKRCATRTKWSDRKKNERNINKDEKNTLFAMACDLCYVIRASVHLYSYICTVVVNYTKLQWLIVRLISIFCTVFCSKHKQKIYILNTEIKPTISRCIMV